MYLISLGMQYNYIYDVMGRIASKSASGCALIAYEYDKNGNKTKEIDVTEKVVEFTYNELDLLKDVLYNGNRIKNLKQMELQQNMFIMKINKM